MSSRLSTILIFCLSAMGLLLIAVLNSTAEWSLENLFVADKVSLFWGKNPALFKNLLLSQPLIPSLFASLFYFVGPVYAPVVGSAVVGAAFYTFWIRMILKLKKRQKLASFTANLLLFNPVLIIAFVSGGVFYLNLVFFILFVFNLFLFIFQNSLGRLSYAGVSLAVLTISAPHLIVYGLLILPLIILWSLGRASTAKSPMAQLLEYQEQRAVRRKFFTYIKDTLFSFYTLPTLALLIAMTQQTIGGGGYVYSSSSLVKEFLLISLEEVSQPVLLQFVLFNILYLTCLPYFYKNTKWFLVYLMGFVGSAILMRAFPGENVLLCFAAPSLLLLAGLIAALKSGIKLQLNSLMALFLGLDILAKVFLMFPIGQVNEKIFVHSISGLKNPVETELIQSQKNMLKMVSRKIGKKKRIKADPSYYFPFTVLSGRNNKIDRENLDVRQANFFILHSSEEIINNSSGTDEVKGAMLPLKTVKLDDARSLWLMLKSGENHIYELRKDSLILKAELK